MLNQNYHCLRNEEGRREGRKEERREGGKEERREDKSYVHFH